MEKSFKGRIIKAYGKFWEELSEQTKKCALKNNGYIAGILMNPIQELKPEYSMELGAWRPSELSVEVNYSDMLDKIYASASNHIKQIMDNEGFIPLTKYNVDEEYFNQFDFIQESFYEYSEDQEYKKYYTTDFKLVYEIVKKLNDTNILYDVIEEYIGIGKIYKIKIITYKN